MNFSRRCRRDADFWMKPEKVVGFTENDEFKNCDSDSIRKKHKH